MEAKLRSIENSGMVVQVDTPTEWISNITAVSIAASVTIVFTLLGNSPMVE